MDLPIEMSNAMDKLAKNSDFIANIQQFTTNALLAIYSMTTQQSSSQCPSYYLFTLNYIVTNNLKFEMLLSYLPQQVHKKYLKVCQYYSKQADKYDNQYAGDIFNINQTGQSLVNVKWSIQVENARQYWNVQLHTSKNRVIKMRVEYQAMAMLIFKLGQVVNHIPTIDFRELPI